MIHSLPEFTQVVRFGLPAFEVIRRPLVYAGEELPVGAAIPPTLLSNRIRLKQLYEQRAIAVTQHINPRFAPKGTPAAPAAQPVQPVPPAQPVQPAKKEVPRRAILKPQKGN